MNFLIQHSHYFIPLSVSLMFSTYKGYAQQKGWSIGTFFDSKEVYLVLAGWIFGVWALVESFVVIRWFSPLVVFVIAFAISFTLTNIFKSWAQLVSIVLGIISFYILCLPHKFFLKLFE